MESTTFDRVIDERAPDAPARVDERDGWLRRQVDRRLVLRALLTAGPPLMLAGCSSSATATHRDAVSESAATSAGATATDRITARMPGARVLDGSRVTLIGDVSAAQLQVLSKAAEQAVGWVSQVWGETTVAAHAPLILAAPKTQAEFRALGGGTGEAGQIAATTTPSRLIVISPQLTTEVTAEGVVVVLAHELTHAVLGQGGLTGVPHWVIEGSAEFTAYRPTGLSLAAAAPQLAAAVAKGKAPAGPPDDADFVGSSADPQQAYQYAYAYCLFLADRFGLPAFTSFVRAADAKTAGAFTTAFGTSAIQLSGAYASFLRARLRQH